MKTIRWRVAAADAPVAVRPCGRCGAEATFASTGLFRVNAQKKLLDVWLIYRCTTCGSVWNCAVISRGSAKAVSRERLERFMGNDAEAALACALDASLLKRNGAKRGPVAYVVEGDEWDGDDCRVAIEADGALGVRLADVLRRKLGLSRRELERMAEAGRVVVVGAVGAVGEALGADALGAKLAKRQEVLLRGERG